jgi:hypothetical protein
MEVSESASFSRTNVSNNVHSLVGNKAVKLAVKKSSGRLASEIEKAASANLNVSESIEAAWFDLLEQGVSRYRVGSSVLDFCASNESARAFVFFSLKDSQILGLIEYLLEKSGLEIVYASNLELSKIGALNLIELCYGDKPFFNERIRETMSRERFAYSLRAFAVVYSLGQPGTNFRDLKEDLRRTLPPLTFERRIHGTDEVEDTKVLVEAITNPNTLNLLNRVRVSRKDRVFSRVPDSLRNNPNLCMDGSSVMELYGLRKSRDLDLICIDSELRSVIQSMGYDLNDRHYEWLPLTQESVIQDPHLHIKLFGLKFSSLAVRQLMLTVGPSYGGDTLSAKKLRDLLLISQFNLGKSDGMLNLKGFVGTFITQVRLLFEFVIAKIIPRLPQKLVMVLRRFRALLMR